MKKTAKFILMLLIVALCVSSAASAAYAPRASLYLSRYDAYLTSGGSGSITVWFDVTATGTMDDIGALTIVLKEYNGSSWSTVRTYSYTNPLYSHILSSNTDYYADSVSYSGISGRSYYANVTIWAGRDGGGDSRIVTTSTVVA